MLLFNSNAMDVVPAEDRLRQAAQHALCSCSSILERDSHDQVCRQRQLPVG